MDLDIIEIKKHVMRIAKKHPKIEDRITKLEEAGYPVRIMDGYSLWYWENKNIVSQYVEPHRCGYTQLEFAFGSISATRKRGNTYSWYIQVSPPQMNFPHISISPCTVFVVLPEKITIAFLRNLKLKKIL